MKQAKLLLIVVVLVAAALAPSSLMAAPLHLRAVPIPNLDPQLINTKGLLVGYDDQDNLVAVEEGEAENDILLKNIRYHINLLQVTEDGEVIYSSTDENNIQTVSAINTATTKHPVRVIYKRTNNYSPILVNHVGDVAVEETVDEKSSLLVLPHASRTRRIALPDNYYPLYLTDDGAAIGEYTEYNDTTNRNDRLLLMLNYSNKIVSSVTSRPINRQINSIVYGTAAGNVYGDASPVDGDQSNDPHILFSLKVPNNKFVSYGPIAQNENLQGLWEGRFAVLGPYINNTQISRLAANGGKSSYLTCNGLTGIRLEFSYSYPPQNVTFAHLWATDRNDFARSETVVLVPSNTNIGAGVFGQWNCLLR